VDANGDGELDIEEFAQAMKAAGCDIDEDAIEQMFDQADINDDGTIDFQEFLKITTENDAWAPLLEVAMASEADGAGGAGGGGGAAASEPAAPAKQGWVSSFFSTIGSGLKAAAPAIGGLAVAAVAAKGGQAYMANRQREQDRADMMQLGTAALGAMGGNSTKRQRTGDLE
jgi:hypothetical protein